MPETKVDGDQVLVDLAREMIASKGLTEEDQKQGGTLQRELEAQLGEVVDNAMLEALPEEKLDELEKLLDGGAGDDEIETFFAGAGVDYEASVAEALRKYRAEYLGDKPAETVAVAEETATDAQGDMEVAEAAVVEPAQGMTEAAPEKDIAAEPAVAGNAATGAGTAADMMAQALVGGFAGAGNMQNTAATQANNTISTDDNSQNTNNAQGAPVQGTVSEMPGASDVEGNAQDNTNMMNDGGAENDAQ